jgi:3-deoxy-7-phosphoheptulonate synthase
MLDLPTPQELKRLLPLRQGQIEEHRQTLRNILSGRDPRIALVVGPCSIHDVTTALEYARLLRECAKEVEKSCFLVMRVYAEKARTSLGWKGLLYDPHLDGSNDLYTGLFWTRELFLEIVRMGVPIATEFLDPLAASYIDDLVAWGFIGARTAASQPHRQLASWLPMPIGFKNCTEGNVEVAINGVIAARSPHTFLHVDEEGKLAITHSEGNLDTHIVLRGSQEAPNYGPSTIASVVQKLHQLRLKSRILIDCSHGNCQKDYLQQKEAFASVLEQIASGNTSIMGMMLESHLQAGNALSITDPCLDWLSTQELIHLTTQIHI